MVVNGKSGFSTTSRCYISDQLISTDSMQLRLNPAGLGHAATHHTSFIDLILVLTCSIVIYLTLQS